MGFQIGLQYSYVTSVTYVIVWFTTVRYYIYIDSKNYLNQTIKVAILFFPNFRYVTTIVRVSNSFNACYLVWLGFILYFNSLWCTRCFRVVVFCSYILLFGVFVARDLNVDNSCISFIFLFACLKLQQPACTPIFFCYVHNVRVFKNGCRVKAG